jgi:hypothetical protein
MKTGNFILRQILSNFKRVVETFDLPWLQEVLTIQAMAFT